MPLRLTSFLFLTLLLAGASAHAATIVGGSALLSAADANQLETWLGEGPIQITNIFTKQAGDDATDFHAAVDGKGRTFSIIEVNAGIYTDQFGQPSQYPRQVIGGYNPQSWSSNQTPNLTPLDADRTAFIFNLTSDEIQRQKLGTVAGQYQTYNYSAFGPTFGGGFDVYVDRSLSSGYAQNFSYGPNSLTDNILTGSGYYTAGISYGSIEIFTISAAPGGNVPEPSSLLVWSVIPLGIGLAAFRRRRQPTV